jgi:hypothetical protein
MPQSRFVNISIDNQRLEVKSAEDLPVAISYRLEDQDNFQTKRGSDSFDVITPASLENDKIANTFHNPGIDDSTPGHIYKSFRQAVIEANGIELLVGKGLLTNAGHDSLPLDYQWDLYGGNSDWMIDLKEATLFDFLRHITFSYTKANIIASWDYDGTDEAVPYVFAPVRYGLPMDAYYTNLVENPPPLADDYSMGPTYLKPSISKYWLLYWGFKSIGYKMVSDFFATEYFRRQVMPWTWGNFNSSAGTRLDNLDFLAKSTETVALLDQSYTGFWNLQVSNDSTNGAFDNSGVYTWDDVNWEMEYTYLNQFQYGTLEHHFHIAWLVNAVASNNSDVLLRVQYFKNGVKLDMGNDDGNGTLLLSLNAPAIGVRTFGDLIDQFISLNLDPGDEFKVKMYLHTFDSGLGRAQIKASVEAFELEFIRIPLGTGTIDFENYTFLNKWKFLDLFRGVIDEFNLSVNTDPVNKRVYIEPTHPYSLQDDQSVKTGGYFNGNYIDWTHKQDLSKRSEMALFSDSERELIFKYKNDGADGCLKLVQDRNVNTLAAAKYVLPDRFKTGNKEHENRFFSPTMHYDVVQWLGLGTLVDDSPQMVCIVPENISNTSADEAQNTFEPKSCYYKGKDSSWGFVFDTEKLNYFPFMFAVNYKPGGEEDPVLSYSDERIGDSNTSSSGASATIGIGLLRRFFLQRMAIQRNGQHYNTWMKLNNLDVCNWLHREHIRCRGQKWELVTITDYKPLIDETTAVFMRKWTPLTIEDKNGVFPSEDAVLNNSVLAVQFDMPYAQLKCLATDIPS